MGYFQVRDNYRVVNYDRRGFIRLATDVVTLGTNAVKLFAGNDWLFLVIQLGAIVLNTFLSPFNYTAMKYVKHFDFMLPVL